MKKDIWYVFLLYALLINLNGAKAESLPTFNFPALEVTEEEQETVISTTTIDRETIENIAGSANDPMRAAQTVPSVMAANDFDARLFIRGSAPEESKVIIDDISGGYPFHFYGLCSTIDLSLLEKITIYSGGFPVTYGNYLGGIIELGTENTAATKGSFSVDLAQAGIFYNTSFLDQGRIQLSFRRGFYDLVLKDWQEAAQLPRYYDYFVKAGWGDIQLYSFGSQDSAALYALDYDGDSREVTDIKQGAQNMGLKYKISLNTLDIKVFLNYTNENQDYYFDKKNYLQQYMQQISAKLVGRYAGVKNHRIEIGLESAYKLPEVRLRISDYFDSLQKYLYENEAIYSASSANYKTYAVIISDYFLINSNLISTLGIRGDYTTQNNRGYLSPRGQLDYQLDSRNRLLLAIGIFNQEPQLLLVPFMESDADLDYNQAIHYILSYEHEWNEKTKQKIEVYFKNYTKLVNISSAGEYDFQGKGYATGIEYSISRHWNPQTQSVLSYVLSSSQRYIPSSDRWIYFDADRTNQITLLHNFKLLNYITTSVKWVYATGQPYTSERDAGISEVNAKRLPDYHRLDIKFQKKFKLDKLHLYVYTDLVNIYGSTNYSRLIFTNLYASWNYYKQLPFIFITGLKLEF